MNEKVEKIKTESIDQVKRIIDATAEEVLKIFEERKDDEPRELTKDKVRGVILGAHFIMSLETSLAAKAIELQEKQSEIDELHKQVPIQ